MKLLYCKMCQDLVAMRTEVIRECECGNVLGRFLEDNFSLEVDVTRGNWGTIRIVGLDNRLLANETLPKYVKNSESQILFEAWGSAVIIVPPWMLSEVKRIDPNRFPEVGFKGEGT